VVLENSNKGEAMRKSTIVPVVVAATCLIVSCQKIQEPAKVEATLKITAPPFNDAIPLAYGQLVSVTASPDPYVAVLWFRKPDETIAVVRINYARGELGPNVTEIPRK
jgi:hypothetical protein